MTNRKIQHWVIPPGMARVLEERYAECEKVILVSDNLNPIQKAHFTKHLNRNAPWSADVNHMQRGVDWQMKIDDARCKLKSVYPQIKL